MEKPVYRVRNKQTGKFKSFISRGADGRDYPEEICEEYTEEDLKFEWPNGLPDELEAVQIGTITVKKPKTK